MRSLFRFNIQIARFTNEEFVRAAGMKKAKGIWFLRRQYTVQEALEKGLVNYEKRFCAGLHR
jgi:1,4-dihydroxy-2-naphthoyl-CoA synthase